MEISEIISSLETVSTLGGYGLIGFFVGLFLPIVIFALIARFRGFFASLFFLAFFIPLLMFLDISIEPIKSFCSTNLIAQGIELGVYALYVPFYYFHMVIIRVLKHIDPTNDFYVNNILLANWFTFTPYGIIFLIFFIFFKKRRNKNRTRAEDDF